MRLVERVVRKIIHLIIDCFRRLFWDAVCNAAGDITRGIASDEGPALFFDVLGLFLAHGAAHHVRLSKRISGKLPEYLDDLLLIKNTAVGNRKDRLQHRVLVLDKRRILLAGDQTRNRFHRTGTVGCNDDGEIFNRLRLQAHAHARHAGRFHLKYTGRSALREHVHDLGVVVRHAGHGEIRLRLPDIADRVVNDGDVSQAEEVHFEKPQFLQRRHGVFRDNGSIICCEGHIIVDWQLGNDHACRMCRGIARHALKSHGRIDKFLDARIAVIHLP